MPDMTARYLPPEQTPQHLEETIFAALERAHEWKLKTHSATVDFVILWLMLGPKRGQWFACSPRSPNAY